MNISLPSNFLHTIKDQLYQAVLLIWTQPGSTTQSPLAITLLRSSTHPRSDHTFSCLSSPLQSHISKEGCSVVVGAMV